MDYMLQAFEQIQPQAHLDGYVAAADLVRIVLDGRR